MPYPLWIVVALVVSAGSAAGFCQGNGKAQPQVLHGQDGGTSGVMESIFVPPIPDSPFTLTLVTEWSRPLGNGGSFTLANQRRIARDAKGRIYQERWLLVPKGSKIASEMNVVQIVDPGEHTTHNCFVREKTCEIVPYKLSSQSVYEPRIGRTGPLPEGNGYQQHEDLGVSNTAGVDTTGYRETTTLNPGVLGNDQPMVTVREFWYSARLGISLSSKVDDPRSGKQVFTVKDLTTSEPDPRLFDVPEGFRILDHAKD